MGNIKSIVSVGSAQTYDLEVDHPDHQFYLSNGVLTSNSHAVAYAFDSYYAAWLHTHYETDWLATILQSESGSPDGLSKAVDEIKQLGYKFAQSDVNFSGEEWVYSEEIKAFVPPLGSVKGIGNNAMQELLSNRPYKSLEDLLFNPDGTWKHSKANKTCFAALCKIEALGSLSDFSDGTIKNHKQLFEIIIGNYDLLKKGRFDMSKTAIKRRELSGEAPTDILHEVLKMCENIDDWSRSEKIENYVSLTSSTPSHLVFPDSIIHQIKQKKVKSALELEDKSSDIVWFCITTAEEKKAKSGKSFAKLNILDSDNRIGTIRVWGKFDVSQVDPYSIWIAEVKKDDWGLSAQAWKMHQVDSPTNS